MDGIPCAAAATISSSGFDAPSRKLKAERACNSMYISHTLRVPTTFREDDRNKCGKGLAYFAIQQRTGFQHPSRLAAMVPHSTNRQKFATVRTHGQLCRAFLEMPHEPEHVPATEPTQAAEVEKCEMLFVSRLPPDEELRLL